MRQVQLDDLDFRAIVKPGDTVIWTQGAAEPVALVERLLAQRHAIGGRFRVFLGASHTGLVRPGHADAIDFIGIGGVGHNRAMVAEGGMQVIPCHLSDMARMIADGALRIDVALMQLAPPGAGAAGYSLGAVSGYVQAALGRARQAIAELNEQAPWTHAREPLDASLFDFGVPVSRPLVDVPLRPFTAQDAAIASHLAARIPDGATLQVGIGGVPNALLAALSGHRDLGLHSGVVGDGIVDLVERGVLTNARKAIDAGVSIAGGLVGSSRLCRFAHRNPALRVEPVGYTHDPRVLGQLRDFWAVNGAIEVDLTGQVNAEVAGRSYLGTVGGQVDFVRGALASPGGHAVIALPSRTARGLPTLVPRLAGGVVTTARSDADLVATEYGVAELRHQSITGRVKRLVAIAHPDDREALLRAAREQVAGF